MFACCEFCYEKYLKADKTVDVDKLAAAAAVKRAYPTKEAAWHNLKCRNKRAVWFSEVALAKANAVKHFIDTHPEPPEGNETIPGFYPPSLVGIEDFY